MIKTYLFVLIGALITGAYFYGANISTEKCKAKNLQSSLTNAEQIQNTQRIVNEKVYRTATDDIRRILREKYSIAK